MDWDASVCLLSRAEITNTPWTAVCTPYGTCFGAPNRGHTGLSHSSDPISWCGACPIVLTPTGTHLLKQTRVTLRSRYNTDNKLTLLCHSAIETLNLRAKSTLLHELADSLIATQQPVHGPNASKVIKPAAHNHHRRAAAAPSATGKTAVRGRLAVCPAGHEEQEHHHHQAAHNVSPDATAEAELRRSLPAGWMKRVAFTFVERQEHPSSAHALAAEPAPAGVSAFSDAPAAGAGAKPTVVSRARLAAATASAAEPGCRESDAADDRQAGADGPDDSASAGGGGAGATPAAGTV
ncbi:unnamed protein product, partial [Ectocarpus fasciculatus]